MTQQEPNRAVMLTPPGAGAIGVIRISGPDTLSIVDQIFQSPGGVSLTDCQVNRLHYGDIVVDNEVIDDVVINRNGFENAISVDICSHGGVRIIEIILQALSSRGVQVESTLDHSIPVWSASNLIEREADEAMMQAKTIRAVRFLALQRNTLPQTLINIAVLFESQTDEAIEKLCTLSNGFTMAYKLITGVKIAIVGPPNSGKSTLFNQFIGRSATVVSPQAGTTRDWVEEDIEINGLAVTLIDTAGQHAEAKSLEHQAIIKSVEKSKDADLRLLVLDGSKTLSSDIKSMLLVQHISDRTIVVFNKRDLNTFDGLPQIHEIQAENIVHLISAREGTGLNELYTAIENDLGFTGWDENIPCLFSERQAKVTDNLIHDQSVNSTKKAAIIRDQLIG